MPGLGCSEFELSLMDMARRRPMDVAARSALAVHLEICRECRGALERQRRLSAAMGVLADEVAQRSAPRAVGQAVLAEVKLVRAVERRRFGWQVVGGLLAASLAMVWWFASRPVQTLPVASNIPPAIVAPQAPMPVAQMEISAPMKRVRKALKPAPKPEAPFIAIPYTLPLQPFERADVVRMDMPVAALIAAGLPVGMMDPAGRARTDVLVGQDGRARAVRLISVSSLN